LHDACGDLPKRDGWYGLAELERWLVCVHAKLGRKARQRMGSVSVASGQP